MNSPRATKPSWIRILAVLFIATSALNIVGSLGKIAEVLVAPEIGLELYPSNDWPSSVPAMRWVNRLGFANTVFSLMLSPVFLFGGIQLFRFREEGRRSVVWGFGLNIAYCVPWTIFWMYHVFSSFFEPRLFPPLLGWFGLVATLIVAGIEVAFLVLFRSQSVRVACASGQGGAEMAAETVVSN